MVWTLGLPQSFPLGLAMGILSSDALLRLPASGWARPGGPPHELVQFSESRSVCWSITPLVAKSGLREVLLGSCRFSGCLLPSASEVRVIGTTADCDRNRSSISLFCGE